MAGTALVVVDMLNPYEHNMRADVAEAADCELR